jgi:hypothetical protein
MCDYNQLSKTTVQNLPVPLTNLRGHLGPVAHSKLLKDVTTGRASHGRDLLDGKPLSPTSLAQGHYLSAQNFQRTLACMNAEPHRCQWCGGSLSSNLIRQHQQPHDHREHIQHHFHPDCWKARLIAIAAIFGHIRPNQLLKKQGAQFTRRPALRETVILIVKKVFTVNPRSRSGSRRKWRQ